MPCMPKTQVKYAMACMQNNLYMLRWKFRAYIGDKLPSILGKDNMTKKCRPVTWLKYYQTSVRGFSSLGLGNLQIIAQIKSETFFRFLYRYKNIEKETSIGKIELFLVACYTTL